MTEAVPFIRECDLIIGPLTEQEGGGPANQGIQVFSDGGRNDLRISFSIKKTLFATPNASSIVIYNLQRETRERIRASLARVRLSVGYQNIGREVLANGGLLSVVTEKRGPDYVTTLQSLDGYGGMVNGIANMTFDPSITIAEVVRNLASQMPGVTVGRIDVDGSIGRRGRTFSGSVQDELTELADQYGFSWSVQNGVFQAIDDNRSFARVRLISFQDRSLISATPILSGPLQQENGVEVKAVLDARIAPGDRVQIESGVNPMLDGLYKVHEIDFEGDTYDQTWLMTIRSFKIL